MPDCRFLRLEPRVEIVLPDIHWPAHRDQQIEIVKVWNDMAGIQFHGGPFVTVFSPELAKRARVLYGNVLENQYAHDSPPMIRQAK
jgi:hypothetical protein